MYQKLQHNFDIIQYIVKDTSFEQLFWRKDRTSWSLGDIICHLRDVELSHATTQELDISLQYGPLPSAPDPPETPFPKVAYTPADWVGAFDQYAAYRQQTLALFKKIAPEQWQRQVSHNLFGRLTLAELVVRIDAYDRAYIRHMEQLVQDMPLNPLLARAVYEIDQYYHRYRAHLAGAASVLDIGVGSGLALRYLILQNPHLTFAGVDVRDLRLSGIEVPIQIYDGYTLPFATKQFDISLLFYVLHHCHHPQRVLAEATRVTRQKLIIIEEFDRPEADAASLDLTERQSHRALGLPDDLPYRLFDKPEFEEMLRTCRLVEIDQQPLPSRTTRPVQKYLYVLEINPGQSQPTPGQPG
jgi:SAM-dependent methyltransferase